MVVPLGDHSSCYVFYRSIVDRYSNLRLKRLSVAAQTALTLILYGLTRFMRVYFKSEIDHEALHKVIIIRLANTKNEESLISRTLKSLSTFLSKTSYLGLPSSEERKLLESVGQTWECQKLQTLCY